MAALLDFLDISVEMEGGFPRLRCELAPVNTIPAAVALAKAVACRRIGVNPRLHDVWISHRSGVATGEVADSDIKLLEDALLQNFGTPTEPADSRHLHGLVAEAVWFEVIRAIDAGLGKPLRIERQPWSVTEPGGDGLTVYATTSGFCFRLWESKYHGTSKPIKDTVNRACRQLLDRSGSYLSRFSLVAQDLADNKQLASFYGQLPELWAEGDPDAGVGITLAANCDADTEGDFDNVAGYFDLDPSQHQAALHLMGDVAEFARVVRNNVWKGCGLWIGP